MSAKKDAKQNFAPGVIASAPWRLVSVKPLPGYTLDVTFQDGTHGFVEMRDFIHGVNAGVFAILQDVDVFNKVYLACGVATWPGEIDLAPDAMHDAIKEHGVWVL